MLKLYLCMPPVNNKYMQTQAITCWENMSFTNVQSNFRQQGRQLQNKSVNKNSTQVLIWKVIHIWSLNWNYNSKWIGALSLTWERTFGLSRVEKIISWIRRIPTSLLWIFECQFLLCHEWDNTNPYVNSNLREWFPQGKFQI